MPEYIDKSAAIDILSKRRGFAAKHGYSDEENVMDLLIDQIQEIPAENVLPIPPEGIECVSDGYHTFESLYEQKMILFMALVKQNKDRAWKSKCHWVGDECFGGDWFIVGIDTPKGSFTYHFEILYFDLFDCVELPRGKQWDGHTDKDVKRLLSLPEPK